MSLVNIPSSTDWHFKPLSAHLGRGFAQAAVSLRQIETESLWRKYSLVYLSRALLTAGEAVCIPIALIEAVAGAAIAAVGLTISSPVFRNKHPFFEKKVLQIASYTLHSVFVFMVALSTICSGNQPNLQYHTQYTLLDHGLKVASAGLVLQTWGRDGVIDLFKQNYAPLIDELSLQIEKDTKIEIGEMIDRDFGLDTYLNQHPEDREFIGSFNLWKALNNEEYSLRSKQILKKFLIGMGLGRPSADPEEKLCIELSKRTEQEGAYQRRLITLVESSFSRIYHFEHARLDTPWTKGRERLKQLDPGVYPLIARDAQYGELTSPWIECPSRFTSPQLIPYSGRREQLIEVQRELQTLTQGEKSLLNDKLIYGENMGIEAPSHVEKLSQGIRKLTADFQRASLMTKVVIDLDNLDSTHLFEKRNLFEQVCRKEAAKIGAD